MVNISEDLMKSCSGCPELPSEIPSAMSTFQAMAWGSASELWEFAAFPEVFGYLRGGNQLKIPAEWKPLIPRSLPVPQGGATVS